MTNVPPVATTVPPESVPSRMNDPASIARTPPRLSELNNTPTEAAALSIVSEWATPGDVMVTLAASVTRVSVPAPGTEPELQFEPVFQSPPEATTQLTALPII